MTDTTLIETIRRVRGRWKLALVLRGAAITVAAAIALLALSAFGFSQWGVDPATVVALRWFVAIAALAVLGVSVIRPALRRVSDERVALYIEEREPALQSLLISAVEAPAGSGLTRALIARAAAQCRSIDFGAGVERSRLRRNTALLAATALAAVVIIGAGPRSMRDAARVLLLPAHAAEVAGLPSIGVAPGSDTIARGSDFAVRAELRAFEAAQAHVVMRSAQGEWQRWSMSPGREKETFEAVLFDVEADTEYYIEAGAVRSATYRVTVVDAPFVTGLALEYVYPAYTGLEPKRVEDAGDIVAPRGTTVRVLAKTSAAVADGRLRFEDKRALAMQPAAGGLAASLRVMRDDLYHVELPGIDGNFASASAQYAITALADQAPLVSIEKPGRDVKVTAVDELFVSAHAEDDYGIARLELVYSVNGGAPQTQQLPTPARAREVTAGHTFFLEELSLQPGDFVTYFVRATDNNAIDGARTVTTDIYFIQIKPFSREYRAAEQAGAPGGGGGGGEEDPGALSERQRQIIAATFNVTRDRATYTAQGYNEALTTIELSQRRLREQVATLLQRMQQRGVVSMDSIFAQIAQLLPIAVREMTSAEQQLQQRKPGDALSPEQRALQQLLRAEALYREVQVQMQQQQGGGGGGNSPPNDLGDLFELEREQLRNQYEQVQRSREEQAQQQVDEALERLRELARRQQQEAERQRQAAAAQSQQQQGGGGGGGGAQQRLADEAEQTARQLERLARENNNAQMAEAARRLQDAADAMRRASAQRDGRGLAEANAARQRLEEAQRRLQQDRRESLEERVNDARRRADQLREQQRDIARDAAAASPADAEQQRRLNDRKNQLGNGVGELESRLDRLSAEARNTNREAARQLQGAADAIRESRVRERIRSTQGNAQFRSPEFNRAQEEQISRDLDRVAQQLGAAGNAARAQSPQAQAEAAGERARSLAQGVEGMRSRGGAAAGQQLRAEARARTEELQELRRQLQQQGLPAGELDGAISALRALQTERPYNDPQEVDRLLSLVARGLKDFEYDLRKLLDDAQVQKLYLQSQGQVPAQFRKAVEEYYRSLARQRPAR